jgi:hypothetical protein
MAFAEGSLCVRSIMSDSFSMSFLPWWFFVLLAVGVLDALIQFSDYMHWRKERQELEKSGD